jgi:hypothetical protein
MKLRTGFSNDARDCLTLSPCSQISGPYDGVKKAMHLIVEKVRVAISKGQMPMAMSGAPPPGGQSVCRSVRLSLPLIVYCVFSPLDFPGPAQVCPFHICTREVQGV